ncbi:uncharacterized protein EI90DRAFT_3116766 [Cantharellus anzutake]|uniref:uncharacterized protein n=1 Tax=Cantharellus anzutake TaxID=1750568 RepID=UPI001908D72C|nr:uncharacterized protein EI90DRAFT_3116766 [Cantharellus anzutake]KAF8341664.1 hypothetical protein EI90DRAFT_3116766 [Cantharellus anzutake]
MILVDQNLSFDSTTAYEVRWFLSGHTLKNRPIDFVHALTEHPWSRNGQWDNPTHFIPPSCIPIKLSPHTLDTQEIKDHSNIAENPATKPPTSSYKTLERYFVQKISKHIDQEICQLQKEPVLRSSGAEEGHSFSWNSINQFSVRETQMAMMQTAPIAWTLLTSTAVGENQSEELRQAAARTKASGKGSNHVRDPYLGCTIIMGMLVNFRNKVVNRLQYIFGTLMFATNTHRATVSILNCIGLVIAHTTMHNRLHSAAKNAAENLKAIGCKLVQNELSIHLVCHICAYPILNRLPDLHLHHLRSPTLHPSILLLPYLRPLRYSPQTEHLSSRHPPPAPPLTPPLPPHDTSTLPSLSYPSPVRSDTHFRT